MFADRGLGLRVIPAGGSPGSVSPFRKVGFGLGGFRGKAEDAGGGLAFRTLAAEGMNIGGVDAIFAAL